MAEQNIIDVAVPDFGAPSTATPLPLPTEALIPATEAEARKAILERQSRQARRFAVEQPSPMAPPSPQQRQGMEDVPLDITTGIPAWDRLQLERRRTRDDQLRYLEEKYPGRIRMSPQGRWIVRVKDEQDQPKDVIVDPIGIEPQDATAVVAAIPEMLGELSALFTRRPRPGGGVEWALREFRPGIMEATKTAVRSAVRGQAVGAVEDVGIRGLEGAEIDPLEIAKSRALLAGLNLGIEGAVGTTAKIITKLRTPFANPGVDQLNFREAQEYFRPLVGEVQGTPYELTGSTVFGNIEEAIRKRPGGSGPFKSLRGETEESFQRVQNVALGLQPDAPASVRDALIASPEEVGEGAVRRLRGEAGATEFPIERARHQTIKEGTKEVAEKLDIIPTAPVNVLDLGGRFRGKAVASRDLFNTTKADYYNRVFDHPLALEKNIDVPGVVKTMKRLKEQMPSKENITTVPIGVIDQYGNVITRDITGKEVLKEFIPEGVLKRIDTLIGLKGQKMALNELKQMRTDVDNAIMQGAALTGTKDHYLKRIYSELSDAIDDGLKQINDPGLTRAWNDATSYYKANVDKYTQIPIARMFKTEEQAGGIGDIELVELIRRGGSKGRETYLAFKEFYGDTSPEILDLQRSIKDDLYNRSYSDQFEAIDGKEFLDRMNRFSKDNPEIAEDLFGPVAKELSDLGATLGVAQGKIEFKALQQALSSPTRSAFFLQELISAENKAAQKYTNDLLAKAAKGEIDSDKIVPSEFVSRFLLRAERKDIAGVMKLIDATDPATAQGIRQNAVYELFRNATPTGGKFQKPYTVRGTRLEPSGIEIEKALNDPSMRPRYEELLGPAGMKTLDNYVKLLRPSETREKTFAAMAGISAGMSFGNLISLGLLKFVKPAARTWLESVLVTHPAFRRWVSNTALPPDKAALAVNTMIASAPFIISTLTEFGEEKGREVIAELKDGINGFQRALEQRFPQPQGPRQQTAPSQVDVEIPQF